MREPTTLFTARRLDVTLADALAHAPDGPVLLSTPWEYVVTTTDAVRTNPPDAAFEARAFSSTAELRWLNEADGRGVAVLLTEDETEIGAFFTDVTPRTDLWKLDGSYLLWGRVPSNGTRDGSSSLTTERIGTLTVPVTLPPGAHAQVTTTEYIALDDQGNAHTFDERLRAFTPATTRDPGKPE